MDCNETTDHGTQPAISVTGRGGSPRQKGDQGTPQSGTPNQHKTMKYRKTSIVLASAAILAVGTQFAGAVPGIKVMSGAATPIIVFDGDAADLDPTASGVIVATTIASWAITITTGKVIPSPGLVGEFLHFGIYATALPGADPLTLLFSDDEGPTLPTPFTAQIGGSLAANSTLMVDNWWGGDQFDTDTLATQFWFDNSASGVSKALDDLGPDIDSATWTTPTWTARAVLTSGPNGGTTSFNESKVPDGGTTLALLGCSMLGLGGLRRKFSKG